MMNRVVRIHSEISVCLTCMISHANGEDIREEGDGQPDPFSQWVAEFGNGYTIAMGGEHYDNCTDEDRAEGCDCEELGFSWSSCQGCDSGLGGDRYRFTVFLPDLIHVNYPHEAGYLYDCPACELGPCVCSERPDRAPCVSSECERES